jgi:iron(III) transport system substrate-binding protein
MRLSTSQRSKSPEKQTIALWSSLEEYELTDYLSAAAKAFPNIRFTLSRMSTGQLSEQLRRRSWGDGPPIIFGTAATTLSDPTIEGGLAPCGDVDAPFTAQSGRWVAASGFRNAWCCAVSVLAERVLSPPTTWQELAHECLAGQLVLPDPQRSGAGALMLSTIVQGLGPTAAWSLLGCLKRNAAKFLGSSWPCAKAAEELETPIAVSVEIAALRLARENSAISAIVPGDLSGIEAEGFAIPAGHPDLDVAKSIIAWSVSSASVAIARRWNKVVLDDIAPHAGQFVIDHAQAGAERDTLALRFAHLGTEGPSVLNLV